MRFRVTLADGRIHRFSAAGFTVDGSGHRFHDSSDRTVAAYASGQVASVTPDDIEEATA